MGCKRLRASKMAWASGDVPLGPRRDSTADSLETVLVRRRVRAEVSRVDGSRCRVAGAGGAGGRLRSWKEEMVEIWMKR